MKTGCYWIKKDASSDYEIAYYNETKTVWRTMTSNRHFKSESIYYIDNRPIEREILHYM